MALVDIPSPIIPTNKFVNADSRYIKSNVIYYIDKKFITFSTYRKKEYPTSAGDVLTIITKRQEYRPDLMAFDYLGDPALWWVIMEANGISDIFNFKTGLNIRIPAVF